MKQTATFLFLFLFYGLCTAGIVGQEVEYHADGMTFKGYLAYDDAITAKRPGVLVVHEWWGHNAYTRKRADMLAKEGYTALAVDMYGDGKQADHPADAGKFASEVRSNMASAVDRFEAAKSLLQQQSTVNPDEISAIGYCFGGGVVLEMARRGVDLDLVASFHGSLGTDNPAQPGKVKAKVRVYNGADDPFVKAGDIEALKNEMKAAGVDYAIVSYPGAKHAFTNPDIDAVGEKFQLPLAYNAEADKKSWADYLANMHQLYGPATN